MSYLRGMMVVVLFTTLLIVGCGGGGGGSQQDWVVGDWDAYALSYSLDGERYGIEEFGAHIHFRFNSDGTWNADLYLPGQGDHVGLGTWFPRSDGYLLVDGSDQSQMRLFRQGAQMYYVEMVDGQLCWLWFRRT